jgi:hypothetical protein
MIEMPDDEIYESPISPLIAFGMVLFSVIVLASLFVIGYFIIRAFSH